MAVNWEDKLWLHPEKYDVRGIDTKGAKPLKEMEKINPKFVKRYPFVRSVDERTLYPTSKGAKPKTKKPVEVKEIKVVKKATKTTLPIKGEKKSLPIKETKKATKTALPVKGEKKTTKKATTSAPNVPDHESAGRHMEL